MSTQTNILVNIVGEFHKKGFNDAQRATGTLDRSFKRLGRTLAAAFSVTAITQFSKASIKAFAEDEKAANRLSQTVKNLGLGFADPSIKAYLSSLEQSASISDDVLRPSLERLLRTTGSVTQSQNLLNLALDISRGTGMDLESVANDLSRAYVGQTRGLLKYNLGLSTAELKTKSFAEVQALLTKQFSGQSSAYLKTYSGKLETLNVAYQNMQETIGKGLVDAITTAAGDQGMGKLTQQMEDFGRIIGDVARGVGVLVDYLEKIPGIEIDINRMLGPLGYLLQYLGKNQRMAESLATSTQRLSPRAVEKESIAADKAAAIRQKKLIALQKKAELDAARRAKEAAKREREQQALKRAGTVFDMENIQIVAALQGRITDEQRLRLTALLAINNGNAEAAQKLTEAILAANAAAFATIGVTMKAGDTVDDVIKKIIDSQTKIVLVGAGISSLPKAKNPFEDWPSIIAQILSGIGQIGSAITNLPSAGGAGTSGGTRGNTTQSPTASGGGVNVGGQIFGTDANSLAAARYTAQLQTIQSGNAFTNQLAADRYTAMLADIQSSNQLANDLAAQRYEAMQNYYVTVNVAGNVTAEQDLVDSITNQLYVGQKSGKGLIYSSRAI